VELVFPRDLGRLAECPNFSTTSAAFLRAARRSSWAWIALTLPVLAMPASGLAPTLPPALFAICGEKQSDFPAAKPAQSTGTKHLPEFAAAM
jgi:hypothetical protein